MVTRAVNRKMGIEIRAGSPQISARYHQEGFTTRGPNYIPLTNKAKRKPPGADPELFDLVQGHDYVMAWQGVTIPARPMVRFTRDNLREIMSVLRPARRRRSK